MISSQLEFNSEEDWDFFEDNNAIPEEIETIPPKKSKLSSLLNRGTNKLVCGIYNIYKQYPSNPCEITDSPLWLFGKIYDPEDEEDLQKFTNTFYSTLWLTYRKDFEHLESSDLTNDCGWGCMLRTGQMILARVLINLFLGQDWFLSKKEIDAPFSTYRQILRWFLDSPENGCYYSIHNIIHKHNLLQKNLNKKIQVGKWFSPSIISQILQSLVKNHKPNDIRMYVPSDGVIYTSNIAKLCTKPQNTNEEDLDIASFEKIEKSTEKPITPGLNESEILIDDENLKYQPWSPLFILIPLRLGISETNPIYHKNIFQMLSFPQSVGIIGGKPKQSLYFVGYQDDNLLYLDPHIVQDSIVNNQTFTNQSYHCEITQKLNINQLDPSLAAGFFCKDQEDFEDFCFRVNNFQDEPPFTVLEGENPLSSYVKEDLNCSDFFELVTDEDNLSDEEDIIVV